MLRFLLRIFLIFSVFGLLYFFLPGHIKADIVEGLSRIVPVQTKEKIIEATQSPAERRKTLIGELRENLEEMRDDTGVTNSFASNINSSLQVLGQLEAMNTEESLADKLKTKAAGSIFETLRGSSPAPICPPDTAHQSAN